MELSALMDFPDDARYIFHESTMYAVLERLKKAGVTRVYLQYYGDKSYGHFWDHNAPTHGEMVKTADILPNYSRVFVEAAKAYGMEAAVIMRPQEQGIWLTYSPYYKEARDNPGIPYTGGNIMIASKFLFANPELRIKRREWDLDPDVLKKTVSKIKLYKQNNSHTRIKKENISIYVSRDNSSYKKYQKDFNLEFKTERAQKDSFSAGFKADYPVEVLCQKGDEIEIMELSGLDIDEQYMAVGVNCQGAAGEMERFINTPINGISIHEDNGTEICSSPGHASRFSPPGTHCLEAGFHFDDGFGFITEVELDSENQEGFFAISKGKDKYIHAALCECESKVMDYWMKWLEKALDDGFDMLGTRIECHSVHVDDPLAYGYNDCIKEEYFNRFGECSEKQMDTSKIASIRGDAYSRMLKESADRTRKRGKKFILTLNMEMLYNPIPLARQMAYPMNVEWQWERWIEETKPDEINIRSYQMTPKFILEDPQCRNIIDTAASFGAPMTLERYDYWDFAEDFKMVRDTGLFSRMTLYEINDVIRSDGKGGIIELKPELLEQLEHITGGN
jgi:hypothetical protein